MGLFDKIKKAIDDSGVVEAAKEKVNGIIESQSGNKTNDDSSGLPKGKEPELAEFYNLLSKSSKCKKPDQAREIGIAAINEFINAYTPSLSFLSNEIKERIWSMTVRCGVECDYKPQNEENKNMYLHFIYAMKNVSVSERFEEKVNYLWNRYQEEYDPTLDNDLLYTDDLFGKTFKQFKLMLDYFPQHRKVKDPAMFETGSCEHGDCLICKDNWADGEVLFCTCDSSKTCDKKEDYKIGKLIDEGLMPALRSISLKKDYCIIKAAEYILDRYAPLMKNRTMAEFMAKDIENKGVSKSTAVRFFVKLSKSNFEFNYENTPTYIKVLEILKNEYDLDIENADWLANPSLYTKENLSYILRVFLWFSNKKWVDEHLIDTSVVNLNEFYDENGCVKDAGSEDDSESDTIYNIVERWSLNNSNEEVFAEEKRKREEEKQKREAEREKMRKRREMCGSCQNSAGCLAKGNVDFCPRFVPYRY